MVQKILMAELILKGGVGLCLLLLPITTARVFGLPHGQVGLWGRVVGALLVGIAGAVWVENDLKTVSGIGLGGLIAINIAGMVSLIVIAILSSPATKRGAIALWVTILVLFSLSILEIGQI